MSAPAAVDGEALRVGLASRVPPQAPSGADRVVRGAVERRSADRLSRLSREYDELCTQAVDRFEIAAGLEAAGVNDRQARGQYGVASVFELAQHLYDKVPRRPSGAGATPDRRHRHPARHLLRGVLYGLPGLLYVAALRAVPARPEVTVLLASTVVACAFGQGLSFLGHVLVGRGDRRAGRTLFRTALLTGGALVPLPMAASVLMPVSPETGLIAGSQVEYVLAATVLMLLDADLLLLAVLAPGVILAGMELGLGTLRVPTRLVLSGLGLCLIGAVGAAWGLLGDATWRQGRSLRNGLAGRELLLSLSYVVYGFVNAALLSFAAVDVLTRRGAATDAAVVLTMLPLAASLGVAEWLQHLLRGRVDRALRSTTTVRAFARRARRELSRAVLAYAGLLSALTAALVAWLEWSGRTASVLVLEAGGYTALGLVFFLDTVLLSCGLHRLALGLTSALLILDTALRWPARASGSADVLAWTHLAVFTTLLVVLLGVGTVQFGRLARHQ